MLNLLLIFNNIMTRNQKYSLSILLFIPLFVSCLRNSVSDGGGTDVGNPAKICVIDSLGQPVKNASVKIINMDKWFLDVNKDSFIIDSGLTNDKGEVCFDTSILSKNVSLQVDYSSGGVFIKKFSFNNSYVKLKRYGKIVGEIKEKIGKMVIMYGSTYGALIDTNGFYIFPKIPEGIYDPVIYNTDEELALLPYVNVLGGETTKIENQNVSFNSFVIEDFEDSLATVKIGKFISNSRIYNAFADNEGTVVEYLIVPEGINGTNCLSGRLLRNDAWALIGFFLGEKTKGDSLWNFTNATECTFYAKGRGKVNVSFESDTIDKLGYFKHYSADITLESEWRHFTLSFDSLKLKNDGNENPPLSWKESAKTIKRIEFNSLESDTVDIWLDEIIVKGVKLF